MCFAPFELNDESFSGMDSLRVLSLKGNLREVKASYFSSARTLEDLDISSLLQGDLDGLMTDLLLEPGILDLSLLPGTRQRGRVQIRSDQFGSNQIRSDQ